MGQGFSKEGKDGFSPFTIEHTTKENIEKINGVLETFRNNNVGPLVQYLDETNLTKGMKGEILKHHQVLIDNHKVNENDEELLKRIGLTTDEQMISKFPNHMLFENTPGLKDIKGNIINILKNYRFYEYKYIFLNLFIMQFSETIIKAFEQTMIDIKTSASAYIIQQNNSYGDFIKEISDMVALKPEDVKTLNDLSSNTQERLKESVKHFIGNLEGNQMKTIEEVLKSLQQVKTTTTDRGGKRKGGRRTKPLLKKTKPRKTRRNTN